MCPQLLERAGQSVHWIGVSWETTQVPWPFLGTQLLEGEGLEWFLEGVGGCIYFRLWLLALGLLLLWLRAHFLRTSVISLKDQI